MQSGIPTYFYNDCWLFVLTFLFAAVAVDLQILPGVVAEMVMRMYEHLHFVHLQRRNAFEAPDIMASIEASKERADHLFSQIYLVVKKLGRTFFNLCFAMVVIIIFTIPSGVVCVVICWRPAEHSSENGKAGVAVWFSNIGLITQSTFICATCLSISLSSGKIGAHYVRTACFLAFQRISSRVWDEASACGAALAHWKRILGIPARRICARQPDNAPVSALMI
eukprot:ANDGO_04166.mRNA.1 hypothetical protein